MPGWPQCTSASGRPSALKVSAWPWSKFVKYFSRPRGALSAVAAARRATGASDERRRRSEEEVEEVEVEVFVEPPTMMEFAEDFEGDFGALLHAAADEGRATAQGAIDLRVSMALFIAGRWRRRRG